LVSPHLQLNVRHSHFPESQERKLFPHKALGIFQIPKLLNFESYFFRFRYSNHSNPHKRLNFLEDHQYLSLSPFLQSCHLLWSTLLLAEDLLLSTYLSNYRNISSPHQLVVKERLFQGKLITQNVGFSIKIQSTTHLESSSIQYWDHWKLPRSPWELVTQQSQSSIMSFALCFHHPWRNHNHLGQLLQHLKSIQGRFHSRYRWRKILPCFGICKPLLLSRLYSKHLRQWLETHI